MSIHYSTVNEDEISGRFGLSQFVLWGVCIDDLILLVEDRPCIQPAK